MLNESVHEIGIRIGSVYRENRLIPITMGKKVTGAYAFLNKIRRSTVRSEDLVCCLALPDASEGVFLDSSGREYLITEKELKEKIEFVNSKFQKRVIPRYTYKRGSKKEYAHRVAKFLVGADISKRYKGWVSANGVVGQELLSEGFTRYKVGSIYRSDDGDFIFKILKKLSGAYQIKDLEDGKVYKVELADLELLNAVEDNSIDESDSYCDGYKIHRVADKNGEKNVEVYKNGKFVAYYDNEKEARREIESGEIDESFSYMTLPKDGQRIVEGWFKNVKESIRKKAPRGTTNTMEAEYIVSKKPYISFDRISVGDSEYLIKAVTGILKSEKATGISVKKSQTTDVNEVDIVVKFNMPKYFEALKGGEK